MTDVQPITDDASYERAQTRVRQLMNNWADEVELAELKALSKAVTAYAETRFDIFKEETDGVCEVAYMLDQGIVTLDALVPVFGGMEQLVDYMTRRQNLNDETIDAIVLNFNTEREWIDKPFCRPEGWQDITMEDVEPCDDDACTTGIGEWRERLLAYREELTGIDRIVQDVGDSVVVT